MVDKTDNPENMKEFDITENDSDSITERKEIVSEVVDILKIELDKKLGSIKNDIIMDVKEVLDKINTSKPNVDSSSITSSPISPPPSASPPQSFDIAGMIKKLSGKDGSVSASDISSLISGAQQQIQNPMANKDGTPLDIDKLSEGQLKYLSTQQNHQLMVQLLPSLIQMFQGNSGGDSMVNKFLNDMAFKQMKHMNIFSEIQSKQLSRMMLKEDKNTEQQTRKTNKRFVRK